jgi:hypothetical protein
VPGGSAWREDGGDSVCQAAALAPFLPDPLPDPLPPPSLGLDGVVGGLVEAPLELPLPELPLELEDDGSLDPLDGFVLE